MTLRRFDRLCANLEQAEYLKFRAYYHVVDMLFVRVKNSVAEREIVGQL